MLNEVFIPLSKSVFKTYESSLMVNTNTFYHYTSGEALYGIINNLELWATNASFLNDKSEIDYSIKIVRDYISITTNLKSIPWINDYITLLDNQKIPEIFICSFSKSYDDLNQWRGYGSLGNSYCIEFNKLRLDTCLWEFGNIHNVIYDKSEQLNIIDYIFNEGNSLYNSLINDPNFNLSSFLIYFNYVILLLLPLFKHYKFSSEEEIRIVIREETIIRNKYTIQHKLGKNSIIPYHALKFSLGGMGFLDVPIDSITIGPNIDFLSTEKGIKSLINTKSNGQGNFIHIRRTEIPYRI